MRKKALAGFSGGMRQRFGIAQALIGNPGLIIVDEPTAGLDPEERNRFLNLLAEIGEHVVVILSTHIVEDVSDLCQRMAIIADGRIVRAGAPRRAHRARCAGRIWRKLIDKSELAAHRAEHNVISTRLFGGRTVIHVLADTRPGDGFEPARRRARGRVLLDRCSAPHTRGLRSRMFRQDRGLRVPLSPAVARVRATAVLFALLTFGSVTSDSVQIGGVGNVKVNSPYAIANTLVHDEHLRASSS